jgi:hypothetical protein
VIFTNTIIRTDTFKNEVLRWAHVVRVKTTQEAGKVAGAILEILQLKVAKAEALILNRLKNAGTPSSKQAYAALIAEFFNGQDTSALFEPNIRYKWDADASKKLQTYDVRLIAVKIDSSGNPLPIATPLLTSKIYECKSWQDVRSAEMNSGQAGTEVVARAIQEYLFNGLAGQPAEIQLVINDLGGSAFFGGVYWPTGVAETFEKIKTLEAFREKDTGNIPSTYEFKESGAGRKFARIVLKDAAGNILNTFSMVPMSSIENGHQIMRIEFNYQENLERSTDPQKPPIWSAAKHVVELVSWDPTLSRAVLGIRNFILWTNPDPSLRSILRNF